MSRIEEIRARCEAATPGPWETGWGNGVTGPTAACFIGTDAHCGIVSKPNSAALWLHASVICRTPPSKSLDTEFIAHSREDVPYLLSEVDRLTKELAVQTNRGDEWRKMAAEWQEEFEQYRQMEREGPLVRPPCKIGNWVYAVTGNQIEKAIVKKLVYNGENWDLCVYAHPGSIFDFYGFVVHHYEICKTVFLTEQAAKEAINAGVE